MTKEEWRKEIAGHTPGPWEINYGGLSDTKEVMNRREFVRFCKKVWDATTNRGKHLYVIYGKGNGKESDEDVIVAIVGNGPKSPMNASLIAAAPQLLKETEVR